MLSRLEGIPSEVCSPESEVRSPHRVVLSCGTACGFLLAAVGLLAVGCNSGGADETGAPIVLGMTPNAPVIYNDPQLTLYEVQTPVELPVRAPTAAEAKALATAEAPFPHEPFMLNSDESVEVHYTLTNLDDEDHNIYILLDAWNEFVRYKPGVTFINDEETLPNLSPYQNYITVPGKSRVEGNITTDDTTAMAIGLAAAMNVMAQPANAMATYDQATLMNHIFDPQNRPIQNDPLVGQYVPSVIPGLTGFDLGLRAEGGEDTTAPPGNVAVEIIVDATDLSGNHFVTDVSGAVAIGLPPAVLTPPAANAATGD